MKKILPTSSRLLSSLRGFSFIASFAKQSRKKMFPFALGALAIMVPVLFLVLKSPHPAEAAWYGTTGWYYRQKITIDHTKVSGGPLQRALQSGERRPLWSN